MKERERFIHLGKDVIVNARHIVKAERSGGKVTLYIIPCHAMTSVDVKTLDEDGTAEIGGIFGDVINPQ